MQNLHRVGVGREQEVRGLVVAVGAQEHGLGWAGRLALGRAGGVVGVHEGEVAALVADDPHRVHDRAAGQDPGGGQALGEHEVEVLGLALVAVLGDRPGGDALGLDLAALEDFGQQGDRARDLDEAGRVGEAAVERAGVELAADLGLEWFGDRAVLEAGEGDQGLVADGDVRLEAGGPQRLDDRLAVVLGVREAAEGPRGERPGLAAAAELLQQQGHDLGVAADRQSGDRLATHGLGGRVVATQVTDVLADPSVVAVKVVVDEVEEQVGEAAGEDQHRREADRAALHAGGDGGDDGLVVLEVEPRAVLAGQVLQTEGAVEHELVDPQGVDDRDHA